MNGASPESPVNDLQRNLMVAVKAKNTDTSLERAANEVQNIEGMMLLRPSRVRGWREIPPDCSGLRLDCCF
jgi:hypothetical protein